MREEVNEYREKEENHRMKYLHPSVFSRFFEASREMRIDTFGEVDYEYIREWKNT